MSGALAIAFVLLWRRNLWSWTRAGFWAWFGLLLFLVLPPAIGLLQGDLSAYRGTLDLADGPGRIFWITIVSLLGTGAFFVAYLHTEDSQTRIGLREPADADGLTSPMVLVLAIAVLVGLASLIFFRTGAFQTGVLISGGRTVAGATGYQYTAHYFLFVPTAFLLLSDRRPLRVLGYALALIYLLVGSLDPSARFLEVSMLLLVSLAEALRSGRRRPALWAVAAAVFVALVLGVRGHTAFSSLSDFALIAQQAPLALTDQLTGGNANFLSNWYLQSYVDDSLVGFNYGLVFLNYVLTGFIPNQFFPQKYFLVDWLHSQQPVLTNPTIVARLYGQKSSLIGSFYSDGGVVGVVLLSALAGYLSRKLDGMLRPDAPTLVRALGICWMSILWIAWGSGDFWTLDQCYTLAIPAVFLWTVSPRTSQGSVRNPLPHAT